MLRLSILATSGCNRRGEFGIDHRDAGIQNTRNPARDQRGEHAAFADGKIPPHKFANKDDADTEAPDMAWPQNTQEGDFLSMDRG